MKTSPKEDKRLTSLAAAGIDGEDALASLALIDSVPPSALPVLFGSYAARAAAVLLFGKRDTQ